MQCVRKNNLMKKTTIILNFAGYLLFAICSVFVSDFGLGLFTIYSPVYLICYLFYLGVNRFQIYSKREQFNDILFLFPLLLVPVCYFHREIIVNIHRQMDVNFFTYVHMDNAKNISCANRENCYIVRNVDEEKEVNKESAGNRRRFYATIVIRDFIERRYRVSYEKDCIIITSPSYALIKFNFVDCNRITRILSVPVEDRIKCL
jgi:hypothetical protein